jgi:N-acyl-D-amino-acid deacylase
MLVIAFASVLPAQVPDFTPATPLIGALMHNETAEAKRLLAAGADPNGPRFLGFPPVFLPVMHQNLDLLRAMVEKGADVWARDMSGSTALMWAAFNDNAGTAVVLELLEMGLDPNATNQAGETALTWASRRGQTPVVSMLRSAGASDTALIKDSAQRALTLLQTSGTQFVKVSGCVSCHHQFLPQMTAAVARDRGLDVDESSARAQTEATVGMFKPLSAEMLRSKDRIPDPPISVSYALLALAADNYTADETTAAMAQLIANCQLEDGSFQTLPIRPPIESSDFAATALSIRALQLYGTDVENRVSRGRAWLRSAAPKTGEDRAMQLLGLAWANAATADIQQRAQALMSEQRPDGGWSQLPGLETDAYATGQALVALHWAGIPVSNAAYRRGIAFLLRTQFADGSWLVRSRSFPVQRYKESGFPHGKHQWVSAAGTSWAAMALSLALPAEHEERGNELADGAPNAQIEAWLTNAEDDPRFAAVTGVSTR